MTIAKFKWTGIAAAMTMFVVAPAFADDTELLLNNPATSQDITPNILFILDTSGSMGDPVSTTEIYDSVNGTYTGSCDENYLYWTEVDVVPSCDATNTRKILKSSFVCDASTRRITGIGRYTDTMAQYRDGASGFFSIFLGVDRFRWQQLEAGNETDQVECEGDSGEHGPDDLSLDVYAKRGGDDEGDDAFTAASSEELDWGSWPVSQTITVFDGKYLNYRQSATTLDRNKIDILKDVTKVVLNSVENVNVGLMRFNYEDGGPVILDMQDLDSNRAKVEAAINSLNDDGYTPLAETLYEAARYWRGLPVDYGNIAEGPVDPDNPDDPPVTLWTDNAALSAGSNDPADTTPRVYEAPVSNTCTKNYNVLLSDGKPVRDTEAQTEAPKLPNWFAALGRTTCEGTEEGDCLDDIAEYLYKDDISSEPGIQLVTTHTIAFANSLPILEATAAASGGKYFKADDVDELTLALLEIVSTVQERSLSFAAPAVAVNTFNRTRTLNDLYLTTFAAETKVRWPGNLKKYRIKDGEIVDAELKPAINPSDGLFVDDAVSFWDTVEDANDVTLGGAANQLPSPATRVLITNKTSNLDLTAAENEISIDNKDTFDLADFGLTGSVDEPTKEQIIDWARGIDVADADNDGDVLEARNEMGDPLHSEPAAVVYGGTEASPVSVVFAATNEGYVHAVDGATGQELWAFVPKEHTPNLTKLFFNSSTASKHYGVDGSIVPVVFDKDNDGQIEPDDDDFVYIIFGMRRGGEAYYALDVTVKDKPKLKWRVSDAGFGQTWSKPTVARVQIDNGTVVEDKIVAIVGGGYDTTHDVLSHPGTPDGDGAGVYFIDLETGGVLWRAAITADTTADLKLDKMTRAIPTQIRVIDLSGDGFADRMYASDMGGQIFRFDIINGETRDKLVRGGVIAQLGAEGNLPASDANTRRFYTSPDVSIFGDAFQNRQFIAISLGSGYRAHPLDNTPTERFYSLRDPDVFNVLTQDDYNTYTIIKENTLIDVRGKVRTEVGSDKNGWMYTLPADQKVLSDSVTFDNEIFFVAFSPDNGNNCTAGLGNNFLYRMSVINGDPIVQNIATLVAGDADAERSEDLAQKGIAPEPQFLFPTPEADCTGTACNPPPIGCIGVECFDPGFANNPVRTLWTQDGIE
ncbi:MAG: PilC/PilY family type IV pilus protein [Woeseiaceae bacterium]|nr:PilC/PilY family type IV pilus protein [Woeseiaceae bacterium]